MPKKPRVHLVLDGEGMSPSTVSLRELAQELEAFDKALRSIAAVGDRAVLASLVEIRTGSSDYVLELAERAGITSYGEMTRAVRSGRVEDLPPPAQEALVGMAKRNRERGRKVSFSQSKAAKAPAVEITTKNAVLPPQVRAPIEGSTTLYGVVVGVSLNRDAGTVWLVLTGSEKRTKLDASRSVAVQLGRRLDEEIGVDGRATWDPNTLDVLSFKIDTVLPYRAKRVDQILNEARERFGAVFDGVTSEEFVEEYRGD